MVKNNFIMNFIKIFLYSLPLIDALSFFTRKAPVSVGLVLKVIFLIFLFIYVVKNYRGEKLKKIILFFTSIFAFGLFFVLINTDGDFITEFMGISKLLFLPMLLGLLYCIKEMEEDWFDWNIIINIALLYAFIVVTTTFAGLGQNTYSHRAGLVGYKGSYVAGNDVGTIIGVAISICLLTKFDKVKFAKFVFLILVAAFMGVKTPLLMFLMSVTYLVIRNIVKKEHLKKTLISILALIALMAVSVPRLNMIKNIETRANKMYESGKYDVDSVEELYFDPYILTNEFVLSGRLGLLDNINEEYENSDFDDKLNGIGYGPYIRSTEMDFFDLFYRVGIVGFVLYILMLIYSMKLHIKKFRFNEKYFVIFMTLLCGFLVGHVLTAISVAMILAVVISSLDVKE